MASLPTKLVSEWEVNSLCCVFRYRVSTGLVVTKYVREENTFHVMIPSSAWYAATHRGLRVPQPYFSSVPRIMIWDCLLSKPWSFMAASVSVLCTVIHFAIPLARESGCASCTWKMTRKRKARFSELSRLYWTESSAIQRRAQRRAPVSTWASTIRWAVCSHGTPQLWSAV